MREEGGSVLIHLGDVGGATALSVTSGMRTVSGPVACLMAVEAEVVAIRLALAVRTSCLVRLRPSATGSASVAIAARLVLLATARTPSLVLGRPGCFLLLLLVEGPPLFGGVQKLAAGVGGFEVVRQLSVLDRLEPAGDVLDGERAEVEQGLDRVHDLPVPLRHAPKELLDGALFGEVGVAVQLHLLHQTAEAHGEVLDMFAGLKGEAFPLPAKALQCRAAYPVTADSAQRDGVPRQLRRPLVGDGGRDVERDSGAQSLQGPAILLIRDATDVNCIPKMSSLELYLHQEAPLVVVALGEHRPRRPGPGVAVDHLRHRRTPATTTAPLRRRRLAAALGSARSRSRGDRVLLLQLPA